MLTPVQVFDSPASARAYDSQYPEKNYRGEAEHVACLIRERQPAARSILDVACGTGRHLSHFLDLRFSTVAGVDISAANLDRARMRLGADATLACADMREFDLDKRYDAVTCLFAAIGHLASKEALEAGMQSMARHTNPGGIIVVEPWLYPDEFSTEGQIHTRTDISEGVHVQRTNIASQVYPGVVNIRMHITAATEAGPEKPAEVDYIVEDHWLGLHDRKTYEEALTNAGAQNVTWIPAPSTLPIFRELIVGTMP